jgi:ABC-type multidrug transport system ATPase subunit
MSYSESKSVPTDGVDIALINFGISLAEGDEKTIIQRFSCRIVASSMCALLGGSGSGKTTLLNVLANRYCKKSYKVHGSLEFSLLLASFSIGYVMQIDFLSPHLTVRETLEFHARLKFPYERVTPLVDQVVRDLGLKGCLETLVGEETTLKGKKGVSGGERRRISIALQMLANPKVFFLDEPTSGLDSFTALTVVESLKVCAKERNTTVICSIHQPRFDVFQLFDSVLLLSSGGHVIYHGPTTEMIHYFEGVGYVCPIEVNPADYFIDLSSIDLENPVKVEQNRVASLISHYREMSQRVNEQLVSCEGVAPLSLPEAALTTSMNSKGKSGYYFFQFYILLRRSVLSNWRDRMYLYAALSEALFVGFLLAAIFWQLDNHSSAAIQSRKGLCYTVLSLQNFNLATSFLNRYESEVKMMDRELQDNLYSPCSYVFATTCSLFPQFGLQALIFTLVVYFGANLRLDSWQHAGLFYCIVLSMIVFVNGNVWLCYSISRGRAVAEFIAHTAHFLFCVTCGLMINFDSIPIYIQWIRDINVISYAYKVLMVNEFKDNNFGKVDGDIVLHSAGISQQDGVRCWLFIFVIIAAYYLLACIRLEFVRFPPIATSATSRTTRKAISGEVLVTPTTEEGKKNEEPTTAEKEIKEEKCPELSLNEIVPFDYESLTKENVFSTSTISSLTITVDRKTLSAQSNSRSFRTISTAVSSAQSHDVSPMKSPRSPKPSAAKEITISVRNLSLTTRNGNTKYILSSISFDAKPGKLIALMGGSGSGKTTLLTVLANRFEISLFQPRGIGEKNASNSSSYTAEGEILFNNILPTLKEVIDNVAFGNFLSFLSSLSVVLISFFFFL